MSLYKERDEDLYRAYIRTLQKLGDNANRMTLYKKALLVANAPAERVYISSRAAKRYIRMMLDLKLPKKKLNKKLCCYLLDQYLKKNADTTRLDISVIDEIIYSPAPSFFLTPPQVLRILFKW